MAEPLSAAGNGKVEWSTDDSTYEEVPHVRTWAYSSTAEAQEYRSSSTAGRMKRISGGSDHEGSLTVYIDSANRFDTDIGITPGVTGYFKLYEDATTFHKVPVYIDDVEYESDIEGGELYGADISFSSNGAITLPA